MDLAEATQASRRKTNRWWFKHEPIENSEGQIRLIRLYEELSQERLIRCEISTVDLSTEPEYTAISYMWGPRSPTHLIQISESRYTIRENLWQFLNVYRLLQVPSDDKWLWIDQISIDQRNLTERNHQVQLMGSIFRNAVQVIAWLGWPDPQHVSIKTALEQHPSYLSRTGSWSECTWHARCPLCSVRRRGFMNRGNLWPSSDLIGSPYWKRLWITQEIVLSRDLVFFWGEEQLTGEDIADYGNSLGKIRGGSPMNRIKDLLAHSQTMAEGRLSTLARLIESFDTSTLTCTDPRDLIFGLLGMIEPAERITVDYRLREDEVFGKVLDKVVFSPEFMSPNGLLWRRLDSIEFRLGSPLRWRVWLSRDADSDCSIQIDLYDFGRCLNELVLQGLELQRWPISELGPIVCAIRSKHQIRPTIEEFSLPLIRRLVEWLNSMIIPTRSIKFPEPSTSSRRWRQKHAAQLRELELKRVSRYARLIETVIEKPHTSHKN